MYALMYAYLGGLLTMALSVALAAFSTWLAHRKGQNWLAWGMLSLSLGPIGVFFVALLPRLPKADRRAAGR
ncbi:hypothetical protein [Nonomuraea sp. LPB2021202275-12-8]|uniref:hypothetical protein n=1 Tax=Nonomuraea sp. LPB2021202275-12-8 TaxID=3120159 RepID=UPI00300C8EED